MTQLATVTAGAGADTVVNQNLRAVSPAGLYGIRQAATAGLVLGYYGGAFNGVDVADGAVALTASATNYVVAHRTTGAVTAAIATTNWLDATTYLQLYQVVAGASTFTIATTSDKRQAFGGTGTSSGLSNPMTAAGDIIYGGTPSAGVAPPTRLAATTNGYVLTLAAGVPTWAAATGGFSNPMTTVGDLIVGGTSGAAGRLAAGASAFVLTSNGPGVAPSWQAAPGAGSGTVTSVGATGGLETASGSAITGSGTIRLSELVNPQTGTTYTYLTGDRGKLVTHSNAAAIAGTLPQATGTFSAGWRMIVKNKGAGTLTITPATSTIDGAAVLVLTTGQWAIITSDGANYQALTYAPAGGGGSVTGFTPSLSTGSPNNTVNTSRLLASGGTTDMDAVLSPKGLGGVGAHLADGSTTGGNKRGLLAVDWQTSRGSAAQVASGSNSVLGGGVSNTASASGSTVAGGSVNTASGLRASVGGGNSNLASGQDSTVPGGSLNTASGLGSHAAGVSCTASGDYSRAGGNGATTRGIVGADAFSASGSGVMQRATYVLQKQNNTTSPIVLTADGGATAAANSLVLQNTSTWTFTGLVVAQSSGGSDKAGWKFEGVVTRGASAAATSLVASVTPSLITSAGAGSGWTVAIGVNTTLGALEITVTATPLNMRWSAVIQTAEVIYS